MAFFVKKMKKICIIPARGGSKRIPRKNVKLFLGKPMLSYAIQNAIDSGIFDEIMVSTEDQEIAAIAVNSGAKVPFLRTEATSNDYATTAEVLKEVIEKYNEIGSKFEITCCLYPCTPLLTGDILKKGLEKLIESKADSLFSVQKFSFPPQRGMKIENDNLKWNNPENAAARSQDLETIYHDAGQFYFFRTEILKTQNQLLTNNTTALLLTEMQAQDIDTQEDWELAEFKYTYSKNEF